MPFAQNSQYLDSKVLTAPPQRLHLMLIEGAIRFGRQAADALRCGEHAAADAPLLRVLDVLGEMLASVREKKTALNDQLADFYWYLFRSISLAKINGDAARLVEVLSLLEYERETWQMVCDKLGVESTPPARANFTQPLAASTLRFSLEA